MREITYLGKPAFIMIVQDITNIIEGQSSKMQKMFQEALTATMSHEQMNPLNVIITFTDYLQQWTTNVLKQVDSALDLNNMVAISQSSSMSESIGDQQDEVCLDKAELVR